MAGPSSTQTLLANLTPTTGTLLPCPHSTRQPIYPTHATPSVLSDTDPPDLRRLRPPPSRSAIFGAYGDPGSALSTRSLPNETSLTTSNTPPSPPSAQPHKRPSLFPWTKSSSSATSLPPTSPSKSLPHVLDSPSNADNGSFNLKSFRHIRPPSPTRSTNGSNASLAAPIPRPRGTSINSDASQRISVAAFREAQARRSMAGSPSPSFRDPSPARGAPGRSMTPEDRIGRSSPRPSRSTPSMPKAGVQQRRRSSLAVGTTSESEAESSGEEDSDDETMRSGNRASQLDRFSRPGKARAKSEAGHGGGASSSTFRRNDAPAPQRAPQSHLGHSIAPSRSEVPQSAKQAEIPPRSQSSLSHNGGLRNRASVSTSALTPSAAAQRANALVASNANAGPDRAPVGNNPPSRQSTAQAPPPPVQRSSKVADDSDSEDDAPLATLVAPRRPGSAMSSYSSIHSRSTGNVTTRSTHPKPLIDINELTGRKPSLPIKSTAGFTGGHTLLNDGQPTYSSSPLVESPTSAHYEPLTRTVPPVKFVSPPGSPTPGPKQYSLSPKSDTRSLESQPKPSPLQRDTSPEHHRDLLTDRLSRVVKLTIQPPTPNTAALMTPASPQSQASTSRGVSSISGDTSDSSRKERSDPPRTETRRPSLSPNPPPTSTERDPSPPDEDLAELLGSAVKFISRNGEPPDESSESESSDDDHYYEKDKGSGKENRIAPIPIKQRAPPPAFSVTSRPAFPRTESPDKKKSTQEPETKPSPSYAAPRQRSTTLNATTPSPALTAKPFSRDSTSTTSSSPAPASSKSASKTSNSTTNGDASPSERSTLRPGPALGPGQRQRSSTMLTGVPLSSQTAPRSASHIPEKPFAIRRNSPASSTGDSSSGRAPFTPRDGSDVGTQEEAKEKKRDEWSGGASGLGIKRHTKRRSVSFEDDPEDLKPPNRSRFREGARGSMDGNSSGTEDDRELRRRERRRSEAKAAIELGNIVNGPGPVVSDDDDDLPINQAMSARMSAVNPMMAMGNSMSVPMGFGASPSVGSMWNANMSQQMLSLFPPTFRGRENGLRIDLAEALEEMGPAFFRFPGGNNRRGPDGRQTVAVERDDRPGRQGDWSYINTDGLGLLEYLEWCEDLNMIPIMGIWAGYALGGTSVPQNQLGPYIQQAADQINFVIGDPATSEAAALRARLGRAEPFALKYVEVGNEDFIGSAPGTYTYRWRDIVTALQAQFPDLDFIATTIPWNPVLTPVPTHYDVHVYQTPTWFAQNSFFYDDFQRNGTLYFEGEYAAISTNPNNIFGSPAQGRLVYPTMQSAAGEAAFMTGLERNSDIVFAAAYAPLIGHATNNQWTPNLLAFDAGQVYKSTSFYVQKLFSHNRGDEYIPSTLPARTGTLYWSVVRKTSTSELIIKVINTAATAALVTFELPFTNVALTGTAEVLTGGGTTSNTPSSPNAIVPVTSTIATGQTFDYNAPAVSVSVLTFAAS
ncbi:hypothetical protein NLJ89_g10193 [Agrocybe chaxingu]|uniref:non-reducing end alpha-L-arabinofuranosidase n=1 Tax=Agrocybe chaxingu TaxID=84603 RepID=A0A9W8MSD0_9AGAR|nr:hypothetical protein NLJ89_g10193 [Agrocybe chaxingu]